VSHLRTSIDIICNGLGFAWLPDSAIKNELKNGQLIPLNLPYNGKRLVQLHLVFKDGDSLGPAAKTFLQALRQGCD
jgi:DNA-binding transcriptional LysR family regulator